MTIQRLEHPPTPDFWTGADDDWVDVTVAVKRPPPNVLAGHNRREKLKILEANARRQRANLVEWIEQHDLAPEVNTIGAPTSFNLFFVQCTPRAAQALKDAPGVLSVTIEN
jgi:hypothetical protein